MMQPTVMDWRRQRLHGWHVYHGMLINSLELKRIFIGIRGVGGEGIFLVRQKCIFLISQQLIDVALQSFSPRLIPFLKGLGSQLGPSSSAE